MRKNKGHQLRKLSKRVLILCEGESETHYFTSYKIHENNRDRLKGVEISIYKPQDHSPLGLVNEAKDRAKEAKRDGLPYESIWIVFDKDKHERIPNAFEEARTSKFQINIAFSAICFEYWIFLHYEKRKKSFNNADEIISYIKEKCINGYCKAKLGFSELKDLFLKALINSDWLHEQNQFEIEGGKKPYELDTFTNVDSLMYVLIFLPETPPGKRKDCLEIIKKA